MKTINMKRILMCLLLGISYLLANAQGVVVHKKDGTKIKVPYELLDSITAYDVDDEPIDKVSLIGTWRYNFGTNNYVLLTFNQNGTVRYQEYDHGEWQSDDTYFYSYIGNILKFVTNSGNERETIEVIRLTDTELVLKDWPDGGEIIFIRQAGDEPEPGQHEWVDLGLPSGTLWATCNVGAEKPEDFGDYFAWGETVGYNGGKTNFSWSTYKYCQGTRRTLTKYCTDSNIGTVDNKTELDSEDDAATVNWGSEWCMPTVDQYEELINNSYTTTVWTAVNGVSGRKITSKRNGNSVFLPAAGFREETSLEYAGSEGNYWSRSLHKMESWGAYLLRFSESYELMSGSDDIRGVGQSVRPVRKK